MTPICELPNHHPHCNILCVAIRHQIQGLEWIVMFPGDQVYISSGVWKGYRGMVVDVPSKVTVMVSLFDYTPGTKIVGIRSHNVRVTKQGGLH